MKTTAFLKLLCSLIFSLLLTLKANAQKEANNWYFGFHAGISFNSKPPQALLNSQSRGAFGNASISDATGNLQFYFSGGSSNTSVYNRNHQVMPNGNGFSTRSRTNLIIPWPGQQKYYLFASYTTAWAAPAGYVGYSGYSVIDMTLNNGLGDITGNKNIFLTDSSNASAAVKHRNNRDYWIIFQKLNAKTFHAYLISPTGLNTVPVISTVNLIPSTNPSTSPGWIIKASPDGKTLAVSSDSNPFGSDSLKILNFDPNTGIISRKYSIYTPRVFSALEFSPDGTKLYGLRLENVTFSTKNVLVQYDLEAGSPLAVQNSGLEIYHYGFNVEGSMQVGPDGRIYQNPGQSSISSIKYLHAIQRPNLKGKACRFTMNVIDIDPLNTQNGNVGSILPSFIQSYFYRPKITMQQTCFGDTAFFALGNPAYVDSVEWNFGDPSSGIHNASTSFNPKHFYATPGLKQVQAIVHFNFDSDTLHKTIYIPATIVKPNLGNDTTLCAGDTLRLNAYQPGASYEWQDSIKTDSVYMVTKPGTYWVQVSNGCGTLSDSIQIDFLNPPAVNLGKDLLLCGGQTYTLKPNLKGVTYLWQDGSTADSMVVTKSGEYSVQVTNRCGSSSDKIWVNYKPGLPSGLLGPDVTLCEGVSYELKASGNFRYRWQDGSTSQNFTIIKPGVYYADITNAENCSVRDSITVTYKNCFGQDYLIPNIITPNNDGKNDSFVIGGAYTETLELSIYNRWGSRIYQSENYQQNWKAENTSAGVYYYLLRNKQTNKTYKGWLEVVR